MVGRPLLDFGLHAQKPYLQVRRPLLEQRTSAANKRLKYAKYVFFFSFNSQYFSRSLNVAESTLEVATLALSQGKSNIPMASSARFTSPHFLHGGRISFVGINTHVTVFTTQPFGV